MDKFVIRSETGMRFISTNPEDENDVEVTYDSMPEAKKALENISILYSEEKFNIIRIRKEN